jgi:NADPH:quinone reductase-like Zn-dependent oxidoreductase
VQLAKHFGARVAAVTSGANVERVRALGAADVIDYTTAPDVFAGATYDVIFDTVGSTSYASCKRALRKGGRLLLAAATLPQLLAAPWQSLGGERRVRGGNTPERPEDLAYLRSLAEAGAYLPLIDRSYSLDDIVEAHAYVATGHKRGSVVITMPD